MTSWLDLLGGAEEAPAFRDIGVVAEGDGATRLVARAREFADAMGAYVKALAPEGADPASLFHAGADVVIRGTLARFLETQRPAIVLAPPPAVAALARAAQASGAFFASGVDARWAPDTGRLTVKVPECEGRMFVDWTSDAKPQYAALDPAGLPEAPVDKSRSGRLESL